MLWIMITKKKLNNMVWHVLQTTRIITKATSLAKIFSVRPMKLSWYWSHVSWSKGHVVLRVGASHLNSAPCLVWCPLFFCKWRYNAFHLSRGLKRSCDLRTMWIYKKKSFKLRYHPATVKSLFCGHRHYGSGEVKF